MDVNEAGVKSETALSASSRPPIQDRLCAALACQTGQDPIGSAPHLDRVLFVEMPTPWTKAGANPDPEGSISERIMAIQRAVRSTAPDGEKSSARIYGVAPDQPGHGHDVRAILGRRSADGRGAYDVLEYRFPAVAPIILDLASTVLTDPDGVDRFESYRVDRPDVVDLFVCTHGRRDACCGKFGMPLYRQASGEPGVRAWQTTHFGGHRYAPTAWEFPSGYMWGFLDDAAATTLLERGQVASLARSVRGWSGLPRVVQPLDRAGFIEHGWPWLEFHRSGVVLESSRPGKWNVALEFTGPNGAVGAYEGSVGVSRRLTTTGCGPDWGNTEATIDELELVAYRPMSTVTA